MDYRPVSVDRNTTFPVSTCICIYITTGLRLTVRLTLRGEEWLPLVTVCQADLRLLLMHHPASTRSAVLSYSGSRPCVAGGGSSWPTSSRKQGCASRETEHCWNDTLRGRPRGTLSQLCLGGRRQPDTDVGGNSPPSGGRDQGSPSRNGHSMRLPLVLRPDT